MRRVAPIILFLIALPLGAQQPLRDKVQSLFQQAQEALQKKDYATYRDRLLEVTGMLQDAPRLSYRLAGAYALNGQKEEALRLLDHLAGLGVAQDAAENPDLQSLRGSPAFDAILSKIKAAKAPMGTSQVAFRVAEKDLYPEGIAYDPVSRNFFLSSLHKAKIVAIDERGAARNFTSEKQDGLWSVLGMKVDVERRALWVASSAEEEMRGLPREDLWNAGIFKYDLRTGRLIRKYLLPNKPEQHILNDLVVTKDGDVYITDTLEASVYRILHEKDELERFVGPGQFTGANGIALSADERTLFVATDFGISRVSIADASISTLSPPPDATLTGIDGLYFHGGSLVAIQTDLNRVSRFVLSADGSRVERSGILEGNNPLFREMTTGVVSGDSFYYIANSQYASFNDDWTPFPLERLEEIVVLRTPL